MLPWQPVMSTSFLLVALVITWGAAQGWFSKKIPKRAVVSVETCDAYKREIQRLSAKVYEQQQDILRLTARIADLERQIQQLLDTIGRLTAELDACRRENASLRDALARARDDLAACRKQLAACRAESIAKTASSAICKLRPENANLLL